MQGDTVLAGRDTKAIHTHLDAKLVERIDKFAAEAYATRLTRTQAFEILLKEALAAREKAASEQPKEK